MTDLAAFRMNRAPMRAVTGDDERYLRLGDGGPFVAALKELGERRAEGLAADHLGELSPDLAGVLGDGPVGNWFLRVLRELDGWLTERGNAPEPEAFDEYLAKLLTMLLDREIDLDRFTPGEDADAAWDALVDVLCAALLVTSAGRTAQRATRLLAVGGLVAVRLERCGAFESAEEVYELLRHRAPLLPSPPFPGILPDRRVRLVREATVSDLYVVRSEWRCYEAGEIAEITNVLAGEKLEYRRLSIDEHELTELRSEERATVDEQSDELREQTELSEETQRQVQLAVQADGQVTTSGQYGPTQVDTTVGASADFSVSDAVRRATRLARESVHKAVARVENRRRTERTERTLSRTEVTDAHTLDNPGPGHVRGVYRWVDRVDRYQVFRYPDRLQLEFQFPEPGNALRRLLAAPDQATLDDPGDFTVTVEEITRDSWARLAGEHQVLGVVAPQEETVTVSVTLHGDSSTLTKGEGTWSLAPASVNEEIALPPGYQAEHVELELQANPQLGKFVREYTDAGKDGVETIDRFHAIAVTASLAGLTEWDFHGNGIDNTIQADGTQRKQATYAWKLPTGKQQLPRPVRDRLPVTVVAAGAESVTASALVTCRLTEESYQNWRQGVYDLLLAAHQQAVQEYREEQARLALRGAAALRERSPSRHRQMIQEELRRLVIAWLTGESPFKGRPAVRTAGDGHPDEHTDVAASLDAATEIQFLEQAFEWQNLVYVCYPYYWARPAEWDELRVLDAGDPALAQFLRAGSVRVVVPARPSLQEAVEHWLTFRQPWSGGAPPMPDDKAYLSLAQEIRDQLAPPADGEPGESWEVRLPTAFRWLDETAELPHNPRATLGLPPHQPANPICLNGTDHAGRP
ncbi:hypothetical protein [Sphaerisporangium aureirubrum]|uniref:Uncharacterized protein n=1 Tax=Sphaerisporangium aureirubrum TaxID=1544736 RepID=A0ABW1NRM4_9ACTN